MMSPPEMTMSGWIPVADAVAGAGSAGTRRRWRRASAVPTVLVLVVAIGVVLRLWPTLLGESLTGVREYDDGVHYAAGLALVHGLVPYRDFVLLHPPVIAVVMAPIAALGELIGQPEAMAVARVAVLVVAAANMMLLAALAPPRWRALAASTYALWPGAVVAERTVMLEPIANMFCLLAALSTRRRRPGTAGLLVAAAICTKLFAVTFLVALVVSTRTRREALRLIMGLLVGTALIAGPFFVAAPAAMWHDVVVTQLTRPPAGIQGMWSRLGVMMVPGVWPVVVAVLLVSTAIGIRAGQGRAARHWLVGAALTVLAFLSSRSYFTHYSAFLAMLVALAVTDALPAGWSRSSSRRYPAVPALICCGVLVVFAAAVLSDLATPRAAVESSSFRESNLPQGCVLSESPSLLIALNRLSPPSATCPQPVDPRGVVLASEAGRLPKRFYPDGFRGVRTAQAAIAHELADARALILVGAIAQDPMLDYGNQAYVSRFFRPAPIVGPGYVWIRTGLPAGRMAR